MLNFQSIDQERVANNLSVRAVCKFAGVPITTYWRIATGRARPRPATLWRLQDAIKVARKGDRQAAAPKSLLVGTYRGFLALIAREQGLDPEAVAASQPSLSKVSDPAWLAAARVRALAVYCTHVELGVPGRRVAEAAGMTKQAVSECLKRVEDLRDDPAIDALVERVSRLISGRVE